MGEPHTRIIDVSFLKKLQEIFQKDVGEITDIYMKEMKRNIANLRKALEENNIPNLVAAARELRYRSVDIGAITFSHHCLGLEIAAQEMRLEIVPKLTLFVENKFIAIYQELERLVHNANPTAVYTQ